MLYRDLTPVRHRIFQNGSYISPSHTLWVYGGDVIQKRWEMTHTSPLSLPILFSLIWQVFLNQVTWKLYEFLWQLWLIWVEFWYAFFINCSYPRNENKASLPGESFNWKTHLNWMYSSVNYLQIHKPLIPHFHRASSFWLVERLALSGQCLEECEIQQECGGDRREKKGAH